MTTQNAPEPHYVAAHDQAAAAVAAQVYALVQAAGRHRELTVPQAALMMKRELLANDDSNSVEGLAAGVAMLAVVADRGEIGTPAGMLAIPGAAVLANMVTLQEIGCQDVDRCAGPRVTAENPAAGCSRCFALGQLEEATGLTGQGLLEGGAAA